ncbi:E3 ubiquitin-protein ligase LRSAM1-like [Daktulosphaira vitifoliae]|uniref:E3 ubiquitin-protein ligase LRSAM1-like n=1 Tax=Daktulosphaira vitifoliae TaxID=58002 RepID=UPI0021AA8D4C|nr:E3 ubiquitin-protein ligase LRSAM1-like [Daktulosphaira vitifoliae]
MSEMANKDFDLQEKLKKLELEKELKKTNFLEAEISLKEYEDNKFNQYQNKLKDDKRMQSLLLDEVRTDQIVTSIQKGTEKTKEKLLYDLIEVEESTKKLIHDTLDLKETLKLKINYISNLENTILPEKNELNLIKEKNSEFTLKLKQILAKNDMQRFILFNKMSEEYSSEMEKLTNILNSSYCYRGVLKEHLKSMYNQLKYLTVVELKKHDLQTNKHMNDICQERMILAQLLVDLIENKKQNHRLLIQNLEAQNIGNESATKWLTQFSNLVDHLPSDLKYSDKFVSPMLLHRVSTAGGSHLLFFILNNDLKLPITKHYLNEMGIKNSKDQELLIDVFKKLPEPSAPHESQIYPSAPIIDELECIICMETPYNVVFIPCGHLCSCWDCSLKIQLCPMCRSNINNKILINN